MPRYLSGHEEIVHAVAGENDMHKMQGWNVNCHSQATWDKVVRGRFSVGVLYAVSRTLTNYTRQVLHAARNGLLTLLPQGQEYPGIRS